MLDDALQIPERLDINEFLEKELNDEFEMEEKKIVLKKKFLYIE